MDEVIKQTLVGDIIPFGVRPFDATRDDLAKKADGPSRGPASGLGSVSRR